MQKRDDGAGSLVDDLVDQLEGMLRAGPKSDERNVRALTGSDNADVLDLNLASDHLVPQRDDDRNDEIETILALVRDKNSQMVGPVPAP